MIEIKAKESAAVLMIIAFLLAGALLSGLFWMPLGAKSKKCPACPQITDSISHSPACTVFVPASKIKIRDSVCVFITKKTIQDTLPPYQDTVSVYAEVRDTGKAFDIQDTTMGDGAKVGITVRARLILPPVEAAIRYTAAPDTGKKYVFPGDTVTIHAKMKELTIGTLGGFAFGVASAAIIIYGIINAASK